MEATISLAGTEYLVKLTCTNGRWEADVDGTKFPVKSSQRGMKSAVTAGGHVFAIDTSSARAAKIDGRDIPFTITGLSGVVGAPDPSAGKHGPLHPPMTGRIEEILVNEGDTVTQGQVLYVLEAMKMRNEIKAPAAGVISEIMAASGDAVDTGSHIVTLVPINS